MNTRRNHSEWREICQQYQSRTGSQAEFCREREISANSLTYYLSKFQKQKSFVPARVEPVETRAEIELELPHGIKLLVRGS